MGLGVHVARDLVLSVRVGDDFFAFEHELVVLAVITTAAVRVGHEAVVRCGGAETGLLCAVGAVGVGAGFEVEADLVEALLAYVLVAFAAQLAAEDDGVDELVRVGFEIPTALDPPDTFEAQRVPDA